MNEYVEKVSAWADKDEPAPKVSAWPESVIQGCADTMAREQEAEATEAIRAKSPQLPAWINAFMPGTDILHNGWRTSIRHVGCEEGRWLVLIEPLHEERPPQGPRRAEYKRLKRAVGKKQAKATLRAKHD